MQIPGALHVLSHLCHLPRLPGLHAQLPALLKAFAQRPSQAACTPRAQRRWQLLYDYWQAQSEAVLAHQERRGKLSGTLRGDIEALAPDLKPDAQLRLPPPLAAQQSLALFVSEAWPKLARGEAWPLELRQKAFQSRYPPLHLSARVADASTLSAGYLAIEALEHWLQKNLGLEERTPVWAELAFPDDVKLIDESASLAFAAQLMCALLELPPALRAFSGRVRRDSGKIETVQGFELPYGKLEAAFDAGVSFLYLPSQTPLQALPQAGIHLKQIGPEHYHYFLHGAEDDVMDIHYVSDLQALSQRLCPDSQQSLQRLSHHFVTQSSSSSLKQMPSWSQWQDFYGAAERDWPAGVYQCLTLLSPELRQLWEQEQAGLDAQTDTVQQLLQHCVTQLRNVSCMLASAWAWLHAPEAQSQLYRRCHDLMAPLQAQDAWELWDLSLGLLEPKLEPAQQVFWRRWYHRLRDLEELLAPEHVELSIAVRLLLQTPRPLWQKLGYHALQDMDIQQRPFFVRHMQAYFAGLQQPGGLPVYQEAHAAQGRTIEHEFPLLPRPCFQFQRQRSTQAVNEALYPVVRDQSFDMHYQIKNLSAFHFHQLRLTEVLPPGLENLKGSLSHCIDLAPGESFRFCCTLKPTQSGELTLKAPVLELSEQNTWINERQSQALELTLTGLQNLQVISAEMGEMRADWQWPARVELNQPFWICCDFHNQSPQDLSFVFTGEFGDAAWFEPPKERRLKAWGQVKLKWRACIQKLGSIAPPNWVIHSRSEQGTQDFLCPAVSLNPVLTTRLPAEIFQAALSWLAQQTAQSYYFSGEVGLGKRELLSHSWRQLHQDSGALIALQADPLITLPFHLGRQLCQALIDLATGPELTEIALQIQSLLRPGECDDASARARLFEWLALYGQAWLKQHGTLRIQIERLDLLQAHDHASLELLRYLHVQFQGRPLYLLYTGRDSTLPEYLSDLEIPCYALQRLSLSETAALLRAWLPQEALPDAWITQLQDWTGGRPLHLQECLQHLFQTGELERALLERPEALPRPSALEKLMLQDLKQVWDWPECLQWLTVWDGPMEHSSLVRANLHNPLSLEAFLKRALRLGLLRKTTAQSPSYQWVHPHFAEVLYAQAPWNWAQVHQDIFEYLRGQGADARRWLRHLLRAQAPEQALKYCQELGLQQRRQGYYQEARAWLEQAQKLIQAEPELTEHSALPVQRELGAVLIELGEHSSARALFQRHVHQARQAQNRTEMAWAWLGLARLTQQSERHKALEQALECAADDEDMLRSEIYLQLGIYQSEAQSFETAQSTLYRALGYSHKQPHQQARILEQLGYEHIKQGRAEMAEPILLQAKTQYESLGDQAGLASVYNRLGASSFYLQAHNKARYYFDESQRYYKACGSSLGLCRVQHNLGLLAESDGDYALAQQYFEDNLEQAQTLQEPRIEGFAQLQLSSIALKLRRFDAAAQGLQAAQSALERVTDQRGLAYIQLYQAKRLILESTATGADAFLKRAEQAMQQLGDIMGQDQVLLYWGHFHWSQGHWEQAESDYKRALASRESLDAQGIAGQEQVQHALALVAAGRGQSAVARQQLKATLPVLERQRAIHKLAVVHHNLALIAQQDGDQQAWAAHHNERAVLMEVDRWQISRYLTESSTLQVLPD